MNKEGIIIKVFSVIVILLLFVGCGNGREDRNVSYNYIKYELSPAGNFTDTFPVKFIKSKSEDFIHLSYQYTDGVNSIYTLSRDTTYNVQLDRNGKLQPFIYSDYRKYTINNKDYLVYKYLSDFNGIDSAFKHFWVPDIGVILKKSSTWNLFYKLHTDNIEINKQINLITELLFHEIDFYYDSTLIPWQDGQNYINWKLKELNKEIPKIKT